MRVMPYSVADNILNIIMNLIKIFAADAILNGSLGSEKVTHN